MESLKKNALLNVIKTISALFFPLITFPYASRILLPEGIGKVNFANSIISYFAIIARLGIGTYGTREIAKVRNEKEALSKIVKELFTINLISTLIAYILFFIALFNIPKFADYKNLLCICSSVMLLETMGLTYIFPALEKYKYITIRSILFQFISLTLLFIFVKTKEDYVRYALISIISSAGSNILNFVYAKKFVDFKIHIKLELRKHIKPILILLMTSIAISVFTILDTSMLGFLTDNVEVGYYSSGSKIIRMIRDLFPALFTVLFARLSFYSAKNEEKAIIELSEKTLNLIGCIAIPMCLGLFIIAEPIIVLLCGQSYMPATIVVKLLSPLVFISSWSGYLGGQILVSQNKEKTYLVCMVAASVCDIILNFIFIPMWGAKGAAFATLMTEIIIFFTYSAILRDFIKEMHIIKNYCQYIIGALIMAVTVFFIKNIIPSNITMQLIIPTFTGISIYAMVLFILKNEFFFSFLDIIKSKLYIK